MMLYAKINSVKIIGKENERKHMDKIKDDNGNRLKNSETENVTGMERGKERGDHTEIEQPTPSTATPGIPQEMPVREIR